MTEPELDEPRYFALLRDAFHDAPITRFIAQTMDLPEPGSVRITLHADPRHHHGAGSVHGGIVGLLLDNAGFFASATVSGGFWMATAEFKVNLLESAGPGALVATGTVLRKGRHLVHTRMEAATEAGLVVAVALGTYAVLPRRFRARSA